MTSRWTIPMLTAIVALSMTLLAAQNPMEVYERALVQERAAGDLKQAIQLYERAAKEAGPDRALAARALLRAAVCYEKLGEPRATQLYQQVVRTYPEQQESVTLAQAALTMVTRGKTQQSPTVPGRLAADLSAVVVPMLDNYCIGCHNQSRKYAGLALDEVGLVTGATSVSNDAEVWEKVLTRLQSRTMPPAGQRRPDETTTQTAIALLSRALDSGYPMPLAVSDIASDGEIAARLSRLIWNSAPDGILTDLANRGRLSDAPVLQQQVRRMLADARSEYLVTGFFADWLHLSDLTTPPLTPGTPSELDEDLRRALRHETELFLHDQLKADHGATDLWTANYSFVNERLARYYGIANVSGDQFRRVTLAGDRRAGLLGQGAILTLTSIYTPRDDHARTSPTIRGKWLLTTFLGLNAPPPPPSVPALREDGADKGTMRKRLAAHEKNPQCSTCHQIFEPLGLALENFDVIGRWREQDGDEALDVSGAFADGSTWTNPAEFRHGLMKYRDAYLSNVTQTLLSYALGREVHYKNGRSSPGRLLHSSEMPAVRSILRDAAANNYSWSSIISGIVKSQPFQMNNIVP